MYTNDLHHTIKTARDSIRYGREGRRGRGGEGGREGGRGGEGRGGEGRGGREGGRLLLLLTPLPRSDHLTKYSNSSVSEKQLELPTKRPSGTRTKEGYMWYAEPKTFGIHWIRLYFYIKNGMLQSEVRAQRNHKNTV